MINIKKIKLLNNHILTTADRYTDAEAAGSTIVDVHKLNNSIKEFQKVIAVGPMVRTISAGDMIMINPTRYAKRQYKEGSLKDGVLNHNAVISIEFPTIELDHKEYLYIYDGDVEFVVEDYEEEKDAPKSTIIVPKKSIIV